MARLAKPLDNKGGLARFSSGINEVPWDAGIVFVDLAARVFAAESSYSSLMREGKIQYRNGREMTDVWLSYRIGPYWLLFDSVEQYKAVAERRRVERAADQPLNARSILYGAVAEFIANECRAARKSKKENPVVEGQPLYGMLTD
jgi:hypothetical protein